MNMSGEKNNLLVVGPLPNEEYNCQWGGATVLMKNLRDYLLEKDINHRFVQTNKYVNRRTLQLRPRANRLHFLSHFIAALPGCDTVMFNFSDHGTVCLFPSLSRLAHIMGKRVVLRKFGGSFNIYLKNVSSEKQQRAIKAIEAADLVFFETKTGIDHLKTLIGETDKIHWFPNVRKAAPLRKDPSCFSKRLVYMSHISNEKGVGCLLDAFARLTESYSLDLYGAIKEGCYEHFDWQAHHVNFKGEVSAAEVQRRLPEYDLLLLPTSYREGYPGIIIEALSMGVPVVSTIVGGIPEIITDGFNGRLVTPGAAEELAEAIRSFDERNYASYCENAYRSFREQFDSDTTNERILSTVIIGANAVLMKDFPDKERGNSPFPVTPKA